MPPQQPRGRGRGRGQGGPSPEQPVEDSERDGGSGGERRGRRGRGGRNAERAERVQAESEFQERVVQIRRVTKVVKGGKKLSFRAVIVVGDGNGRVGVGVGKANDVIGAVKKGVSDARKALIRVPLNKINSIPHPMSGTSGAANVFLKPAAGGTGVIAGGAVRTVLELAGIKNILAKSLGSKSPLNNARAAADALSRLRTLSEVAQERDVPVSNLWSR
ncbi:30S ribosomal protein S5 [Gloeobacter kilaueensis]|uniref:Small ribosomal subunit protein uS5 n=1 Tax=Gloeobacter kilaueensis (strain ATCC BAA-2537 / CCAP 1431/1 / ULC 316 / JS1) TaxID=1183438 RepID=U5QIT1_GLOK1|nr:30S ribosomal protein S5 [Gloeobacter kilaueensis JS1]